MNKREFLQKLREYLSYELPAGLVEKNINFYSGYIDSELGSGKSMSEVLDSLGDPQLIARSIADAAKSGSDGIPNTDDDVDFSSEIYGGGSGPGEYGGNPRGGVYPGGENGYGEEQDRGGHAGPHMSWHVYNGGGCLLTMFIILAVCFFMSLFIGVISFLSPVLMPLCMVMLIMWLLSRRE